jgi:hypothetical protein
MPTPVHVYVDDDLGERLRRAMFEHHLTKTTIVRQALARELDRLDKVQKQAQGGKGGRR